MSSKTISKNKIEVTAEDKTKAAFDSMQNTEIFMAEKLRNFLLNSIN